jgi:hypothetical protein
MHKPLGEIKIIDVNKKEEVSFLVFLRKKVEKSIKDLSTIIYSLIYLVAFIYTAFTEGIKYAAEYSFLTAVLLFLIYFFAMVIIHLKYRSISKNSWSLYFIVLFFVAVSSFLILTLKQISYLTMMSLAIVIIGMGVPYLASFLRK